MIKIMVNFIISYIHKLDTILSISPICPYLILKTALLARYGLLILFCRKGKKDLTTQRRSGGAGIQTQDRESFGGRWGDPKFYVIIIQKLGSFFEFLQ